MWEKKNIKYESIYYRSYNYKDYEYYLDFIKDHLERDSDRKARIKAEERERKINIILGE